MTLAKNNFMMTSRTNDLRGGGFGDEGDVGERCWKVTKVAEINITLFGN